jgi:hypothetical protein
MKELEEMMTMNKKGVFDFYILLFVGLFVVFLLVLMNILAGTFQEEALETPDGFQVYYTKELTKFLRTPASQITDVPSELTMWEFIISHYDDIKQFYREQSGTFQNSLRPVVIELEDIQVDDIPYYHLYQFSFEYMRNFCNLYDELQQTNTLKCYIEIKKSNDDLIRFPHFTLENVAGNNNYGTIQIAQMNLQGPDETPYDVSLRYLTGESVTRTYR